MSTLDDFCRSQRGRLGPAWRDKLARSLVPQSALRVSGRMDSLVRDRHKYLAMRAIDEAGAENARSKFPLMAAVDALSAAMSAKLKLLVAANLSQEEIQVRTGIEVDVVAVWEALYFDMRDMRETPAWLAIHVVGQERTCGDPALAPRLKLALTGGKLIAEALFDSDTKLPLEEAGQLIDRHMQLQLKFDEAINRPMSTQAEAMDFIKLRTNLFVAEKRLELAEKKLAYRSLEASRKYELAKLRHELELRRVQLQEAELQQRAERRRELADSKRHQRQAVADLAQAQLAAEQTALAERRAKSPLAKYKWFSAAQEELNKSTTSPLWVARNSEEDSAATKSTFARVPVATQQPSETDRNPLPGALPA